MADDNCPKCGLPLLSSKVKPATIAELTKGKSQTFRVPDEPICMGTDTEPCLRRQLKAAKAENKALTQKLHEADEARERMDQRIGDLDLQVQCLQAIVDKLPKTADGAIVEDGEEYFMRVANGVLPIYAYLSPQMTYVSPHNWDHYYSTPELAEAAKEENHGN